ncbi:MAG: Xaa-Pro peptidase family protein [Peptococcaceae bacterium]|nr:Xaa-Pro peptidase family protein [Peptococcaceae bacterium]
MRNKLEKCLHPMLAKRDQKWFCHKIQAEMKEQGLGYLILQTPCNVFYATGYMPLVGSSAAVVPAEGDVHLIISTLESADADASTQNVDVREFMSWVFIDDGSEESRRDKGDVMDPDAIVHITRDLIKHTPMDGKVGIEMGSVGHHFYTTLTAALPQGMVVDGSTVTRNCRVVKCRWEIDMLRLAAQEADKAWNAMIEDIKPGMPAWKLDAMFTYHAGKLNLEHGTASRGSSFIPAAGPYFGLCGMPRGYILRAGDVIKFDVGFQYLGYWSDIARTFAVGGTASDQVLEVYETLYKANRLGVSMLKPGVPMKEIYKAIREEVEKSRLIPKYPRGHMGHSIGSGSGPEEYPTIAPGTDYVLKPDMVVCLETPYSAAGNAPVKGGFNLEDTHVITADGHESFTIMPGNIFWK